MSVASHELRSPLTGILWASNALLPKVSGKEKNLVKSIHHSSTNLQLAIEEILQLSRLNSRKNRKLTVADCDVSEIIKQVCDTQQLVAEQKGVELVMDHAWDNSVTIRCDADSLKRALHNVISNAIKYSKDNAPVEIGYQFADNMHAISFKDQGIGIPDEEKSKVFNGFYRASNAIRSNVNGTGMGLFLVRNIIEQHGGSVKLESTEDVGTTVTLLLPK